MPLSPNAKLAQGTSGKQSSQAYTHAAPGTARQVYQPVNGLEYNPRLRENRFAQFPPGRGGWDDGAVLIGYHAHKPTKVYEAPQQDWQWRKDAEWQQYSYPPRRRILFTAQVAQKYKLGNSTVAARPSDGTNYFIGFMPTKDYGAGGTSGGALG